MTSLLPILYFVRSGDINIGNNRLWNAGNNGNKWSSTTSSKIWNNIGFGAYYLGFSATGTYNSNGPTSRWFGYPLHCPQKLLPVKIKGNPQNPSSPIFIRLIHYNVL